MAEPQFELKQKIDEVDIACKTQDLIVYLVLGLLGFRCVQRFHLYLSKLKLSLSHSVASHHRPSSSHRCRSFSSSQERYFPSVSVDFPQLRSISTNFTQFPSIYINFPRFLSISMKKHMKIVINIFQFHSISQISS
ncbi:hypothetical protein QL285_048415 [Trifolium repens]|nr:hypothetical protein QL285_048415 [Trifolium repens]